MDLPRLLNVYYWDMYMYEYCKRLMEMILWFNTLLG